jgi:hypothetical protein
MATTRSDRAARAEPWALPADEVASRRRFKPAPALGVGFWASHVDRPWRSKVFASLALGPLWVALALRTGDRRLTGNPWLTAAVAADAALVLAGLDLPAGASCSAPGR